MKKQGRSGGSIVDRSVRTYRVVVQQLREDWIAEYFFREVQEVIRERSLKVAGLSEDEALSVLSEIVAEGYRRNWEVDETETGDVGDWGFWVNGGGVSIGVQGE